MRVDRVLLEDLEPASEDAARSVDLLDREVRRHHRIFAQRSEEAGARRQVAEADDVRRLREDDGRLCDDGCTGGGAAGHERAARNHEFLRHGDPPSVSVPARVRRRMRARRGAFRTTKLFGLP